MIAVVRSKSRSQGSTIVCKPQLRSSSMPKPASIAGVFPKCSRKSRMLIRFRSFQQSLKGKNHKPQDRSSYPSAGPKPRWGTFPPRDERLF